MGYCCLRFFEIIFILFTVVNFYALFFVFHSILFCLNLCDFESFALWRELRGAQFRSIININSAQCRKRPF